MSVPVGPGIYAWPVRIVDELDNANALTVHSNGSIDVNVLTVIPISGTVTVIQGTTPWVTSRTWTLDSSTDSVSAVQSGTWNINNITGTVSLPVGAATEATLSLINGKIPSGLTVTTGRLLVDGSGVVQPVSGTVTALQGTSPWVTSRTWTLTSGTDSIASVQSGAWTTGRTWTLSSGTDSVTVAGTITANSNITQFGGNNVVTGTGASGLGIPRITVSNDSNILATQSGVWNINNITGTVSLPTGAATEATLSTLNGKVPSGLTVTSTRLLIDGSGVIQPVSGTVTANQGTSPWVTSRTWTLASGTDSVSSVQSGAWTTGRTWTLASGTDSIAAVQSGTWSTRLQDGSGNLITSQASGAQRALDVGIDVAGVQVDPRQASPGTLTNRSGTATTTASTLMAANTARKYIFIQNTSGGTIWFNFTATAVTTPPSIRLQNGEQFVMEGTFISTEAISVIAASGSRDYTAKEG